ncbi:MAG: ATP-binding cassette domain-containing protein [Lachnospiraceae bacterium]|nr:ATP-binding cassette domain-containing protein [Lachnospiraceae bacterium]
MELLKGTGLKKKYTQKKRTVTAVEDLSFVLEEQAFLAIVGESGSGKSTLLRLIAGLEKPDEGHLFYRGEEYTSQRKGYAGQFLQMIFQDAYSSFDPRRTMMDAIKECSCTDGGRDLATLLEAAHLETALLEKRPGELSGGECQRMSIIRAFCSGVRILLCDEITSALDVSTQAEIVKVFCRLREQKAFAAIFVSHDIALMGALCENMMVMKDGVCVEAGRTAELLRNPSHTYTRLLIDNAKKQSLDAAVKDSCSAV